MEPQLANRPNTIDVRLRAVASPPPEPVERSVPRIRLPGYSTPQANAGSALAQPSQFSSTVLPAAYTSGAQIPQMALLPSSHYAATNLAAMQAAPASTDGFRPRGSSMR
jgi:hypothetical protein